MKAKLQKKKIYHMNIVQLEITQIKRTLLIVYYTMILLTMQLQQVFKEI